MHVHIYVYIISLALSLRYAYVYMYLVLTLQFRSLGVELPCWGIVASVRASNHKVRKHPQAIMGAWPHLSPLGFATFRSDTISHQGS